MRNCLISTHFSTYETILYPHLFTRVIRAWKKLWEVDGCMPKFSLAIKTVKDKGISRSIELDTNFPTSKLLDIVNNNPDVTDKNVVNRLHSIQSMSSQPSEYREEEILLEMNELARYIYRKYEENGIVS